LLPGVTLMTSPDPAINNIIEHRDIGFSDFVDRPSLCVLHHRQNPIVSANIIEVFQIVSGF
jgi:hypothetical protein